MIWTEDLQARLRELHARPGMSFTEIAQELGTTKNAVSGAANRLGLVRRQKPDATPAGGCGGPLRSGAAARRDGPRKTEGADRAVIVVGLPTRSVPEGPFVPKFLWDLRHGECKWPVGDRRDGFHVHCSAPMAEDDVAYCAAHRRMSTRSHGEIDA